MDDKRQTKAQLIDELNALRRGSAAPPLPDDAASHAVTVARLQAPVSTLRRVRHRLRATIAAMETSDDIAAVLAATRDGLRELGIPYKGLRINLPEAEGAPGQLTVIQFHEAYAQQTCSDPAATGIVEQVQRVGGPAYRPDLEMQDPFGERDQTPARGDRAVRSRLDIPFTAGTLTVDGEAPNAFTPEQIAVVERLTGIVAEGFRRRADLVRLGQRHVALQAEVAARSQVEQRLRLDLARERAMGRIRDQILAGRDPAALSASLQGEWLEELRGLGLPVLRVTLQAPARRDGYYTPSWTLAPRLSRVIPPAPHHPVPDERPLSECPWVREAWERGEPVVVGRARLTEVAFAASEVASMVEIPLPGVGGSLGVSSTVAEAFDEDGIRTLRVFAGLLAVALRRLQDVAAMQDSEERLRRALRREETMSRIRDQIMQMEAPPDLWAHLQHEWPRELRGLGLPIHLMSLEGPAARAGYYTCGWALFGAARDEAQSEAPIAASPWVGEAWQSGLPVTVDGDRLRAVGFADDGVESLVEVPFPGGAGSLGVSSTQPQAFDADALRTLQAFAGLVATALQRLQALGAMQDSEERYRILADHLPIGLAYTTPDGRIVYQNAHARSLWGYGDGECAELTADDLYVCRRDRAELVQALSTRGQHAYEYRMRRKGGGEFWARGITRAVVDRRGATVFQGFVEDVTERRRVELALEANLRREAAMGRIRDQILGLADLPELSSHLQREWAEELRVLGLRVHSLSLQRPSCRPGYYLSAPGLLAPAGREAPLSLCPWVEEAWRHGRPVVVVRARLQEHGFGVPEVHSLVEVPLSGNEGSLGVSSTAPDAFDGDALRTVEALAGLVSVAIRRVRDWEALRESEQRYRTILATAMDGFWIADTDGRLLEVNEAYCHLSGYSAPDLLAMHMADLSADGTAAEVAGRIQKVASQGEYRFESRHRRCDGGLFDVEVSARHLPTAGGRLAVFIRDITERKRAEQADRLDAALGRVRSAVLLVETEHDWADLLRLVDGELRQLVAYQSCCLTAVDLTEDTYRSCHLQVPETWGALHRGIPPSLRRVVEMQMPAYRRNRGEIDHMDRPGLDADIHSIVDVPFIGGTLAINSDHDQAFSEADINLLSSFAHAISEAYGRARMFAEQKQAEKVRSVDAALQRLRNTVLRMDGEGDWQDMVIACERELRGLIEFCDCSIALVAPDRQSVRFYRAGKGPVFAPSDVPQLHPALRQALNTGEPVYRPNRNHPLFDAELPGAIHSVVDVPFVGGTLAVTSTGEDAFTPDDLGVLTRFAQVIPEAGQRLRDLAERQRLEREMVRFQRLRAAAELSAGVSHNLNNILTGVLLPAQILQTMIDNPAMREPIDTIVVSAERAAALVRRLHQAVRSEREGPTQPVGVAAVVHQVLQATRPRWRDALQARGATIEVRTDLAPTAAVQGTPAGLHDVLTNLILNAVDAMPDGGTISIRATEDEGYIHLEFVDTGVGMEESTRSRVFEPFFTTKTNVGTGLGLSTLHNTVTQWGGSVEVESAPGSGTTFRLRLPAGAATEPAAALPPDIAGQRGRILVVDDDPVVSRVLLNALAVEHQADAVSDATQALARIRPGAYDVAIIDLGLPGLSGEALARQVAEIDPAVVRILFTGWELAEDDFRRAAFDLQITKPVADLRSLKESVGRAIAMHNERVERGAPGALA